jgi:hypothetical protein
VEALHGKALGDPDLYERGRRAQAIAEKEAALAEEARLVSLVQRPGRPPGAVVLPGDVVRDLVEARDDGLTPFRLGVISGIVGGIENKIPPLAGSRIGDGYVVGAESPLRFVSSRDGSLQVAEAIEYLSADAVEGAEA